MYTKDQIKQLIEEDPDNGCSLLVDIIDTLFESNREEFLELERIWRSSIIDVELFDAEDNFFKRHDEWYENWYNSHGYKTDKSI